MPAALAKVTMSLGFAVPAFTRSTCSVAETRISSTVAAGKVGIVRITVCSVVARPDSVVGAVAGSATVVAAPPLSDTSRAAPPRPPGTAVSGVPSVPVRAGRASVAGVPTTASRTTLEPPFTTATAYCGLAGSITRFRWVSCATT